MKYPLKLFSLICMAVLSSTAFAQADCQADFRALMDAHRKAGPYHSSVETKMGETVHDVESDVVPPDRFHLKSGPHDTVEQESIFTETGAWNYAGNGKWSPIGADMTAKAMALFKGGLSGGFQNITGLVCLGKQPIEGKSLDAYGFDNATASFTSDKLITYHVRLFVGDNHLPAIVTSDTTIGTMHASATSHITYDPTITISPPKLN